MGTITFQLMIITIISKATGLLRQGVFSYAFGTSYISDIYVIGESVKAVLFSFLFMSLQSCFIPIYNKVLHNSNRERADRFTSNLTNILLVLATIIILFAFVFMEPIINIMASGFTGRTLDLAVYYTRIRILGIYASAAATCMISYLNIYNNFRTPATTGIISNFIIIFVALLSAKSQSITFLAIGVVAAQFLQYVFFPRALRRVGYKHQWVLEPKSPYIRDALKTGIPIMFSILVNDVSIIIDQTIASSTVVGGVSALNYAYLIYQIVSGIVIVSITTAVYPSMSKYGQNNEIKELKSLTANSISGGLLLIIPATVGIMLFAEPIVRLFFERGEFGYDSTIMTTGALFWYAPGLIALLFTNLINRVFYSLGDTKTPVKIAGFQVGIDIIFNIILSRYFGLQGLAAATALGNWTAAIIALVIIRKRVGPMNLSSILNSTLRIILATIIMALIAYFIFSYMPIPNESIRLLISITIAAIVYGISILILGVPEAKKLIQSLQHKIKNKK